MADQSDIDSLQAQIAAMTAERDALRAENARLRAEALIPVHELVGVAPDSPTLSRAAAPQELGHAAIEGLQEEHAAARAGVEAERDAALAELQVLKGKGVEAESAVAMLSSAEAARDEAAKQRDAALAEVQALKAG